MRPHVWPAAPSAYTAADLLNEARRAAAGEGGKLLDWRIILRPKGDATLQVCYTLPDGTARYLNVAI